MELNNDPFGDIDYEVAQQIIRTKIRQYLEVEALEEKKENPSKAILEFCKQMDIAYSFLDKQIISENREVLRLVLEKKSPFF